MGKRYGSENRDDGRPRQEVGALGSRLMAGRRPLAPVDVGSSPTSPALLWYPLDMKKTYCSQCKKRDKVVVSGVFYWAGRPVCEEHFRESVKKASGKP